MNILNYKFIHPDIDKEHKDYIGLLLEEGGRKKSCWFSRTPSFLFGVKNFKDYYFGIQKDNLKGVQKSPAYAILTGKHCPAITTVLDNSLLVKAPCDIFITIRADGEFIWHTPETNYPLMEVRTHPLDQLGGEKEVLFNTKVVIKFDLGLLIGTDNTTPYIYLQPHFHHDAPYQVINGVVPEKYADTEGLEVATVIELPKEGTKQIFIKEGTVLAYLWAPKKLKLKHKDKFRVVFRKMFLRQHYVAGDK